MTQSELLVKALLRNTEPYGPNNQGLKVLKALQAVIQWHKMVNTEVYSICRGCGEFYPCSTIQAIDKELT
jgi:hypothetical protein